MPHLLIVGGSDAGIAAGLARQTDPEWETTVVLADRYPNFSICGLPFYLPGETPDWRQLAHRTTDDVTAAGLDLAPDTTAIELDPATRRSRSPARLAATSWPTTSSSSRPEPNPPARRCPGSTSTVSTHSSRLKARPNWQNRRHVADMAEAVVARAGPTRPWLMALRGDAWVAGSY